MNHTTRTQFKRLTPTVWLLLALGGGAGFINGLLGTGGGILLVLALRAYNRRRRVGGVDTTEAQRDIYATALAVTVSISVFSTVQYARAGTLDLGGFAPMLIPTVVGGVLGGILLDRLRPDLLKRLFALLILVSGVLMIVRA